MNAISHLGDGEVRSLSWFNTILLSLGSSWQESPDTLDQFWPSKAVDAALETGLRVVLGRNLWISSQQRANRGTGEQASPLDVLMPNYYAIASARLRGEAAARGVTEIFLDGEPGSKISVHALFLNGRLAPRGRVSQTMFKAVAEASHGLDCDFFLPVAGYHPRFYAWAVSAHAAARPDRNPAVRCDERTYYLKTPDRLTFNAPSGFVDRGIGLWGHSVSLDGIGRTLQPGSVRDFPMDRVRELHPTCQGQWVYTGGSRAPAVIASSKWRVKS